MPDLRLRTARGCTSNPVSHPKWVLRSKSMAVVFLMFFQVAMAFAGTADLHIEFISEDIADGVVFNEIGEFTVLVTNNGPDVAGAKAISARPNNVSTSKIYLTELNDLEIVMQTNPNIAQDCFIGTIVIDPPPGGLLSFVYFITFPPISPNETVSCSGLYRVGIQSGEKIVSWQVSTHSTDTDTIDDNNSVEVVFGIPPVVVPINAWWSSMVLFISILLTYRTRCHHLKPQK